MTRTIGSTRQLGDLGSFEGSSVASRRKRGPVAFRPRLSAGLALLLFVVLLLYALSAEISRFLD